MWVSAEHAGFKSVSAEHAGFKWVSTNTSRCKPRLIAARALAAVAVLPLTEAPVGPVDAGVAGAFESLSPGHQGIILTADGLPSGASFVLST
jgi:hypothetical protein